MPHSIFRTRFFAALVAWLLAAVSVAAAATFSVDPILVSLGKGDSSASVAITNQSPTQLRLQVTGYSWSQQPDGQMSLTQAADLVFFPQLLTLDPGQTVRVRVGVTAAQGASEKTFRIFMEELPSLASVVSPSKNGITIRMKVGIPVFVAPAGAAVLAGSVNDAHLRSNRLSFDLANTGNTHFSVQRVHVSAKSSGGKELFARDLTGWYVLAGGTRHYSVELPKGACANIASVSVDVRAGSLSFAKTFQSPDKECGSTARR